MSVLQRGLRILVTFVVFVIVWQVVAFLLFDPTTLPTPAQVFERLLVIVTTPGPRGHTALYHLQKSLVRVAIVAAIAMTLAVLLGILMGVNEPVENAVSTWLPVWMTVPTVVVVLVTMIMFNFSQLSVITAVVFAATPYATVNTWKGAKNVDISLIEMADAFEADQIALWRHIYIPSIMPNIFGSLRYLVGMAWKIVVLAETFGLSNGMGAMFRFWFNEGQVTPLLAYLALFIGVMFLLEYGILYPLEERLFRWRP